MTCSDTEELERLSEVAAGGPWSVSGVRRAFSEKSCVFIDAPSCAGLLVLATGDGAQALEALRDARFVVALVNSYRSGPLAQLRSDLQAARDERDRLSQQLHDSAMDHIARDIGDEQDAANLIALAKMYGEACTDLHTYRYLLEATVDEEGEGSPVAERLKEERDEALREHTNMMWQRRRADERAEAAESTASQLSARVRELEEALRPFAKAGELFKPRSADEWDQRVYSPAAGLEYAISGDDLRRARSALASSETENRDV